MTRPHPDDLRELLPAHVAGTVSAEKRRRLDAHLATCSECRSELEGWAALQRGVADEASVVVARPDVVSAVWLPPGRGSPPHAAGLSARISVLPRICSILS